MTEVSNNAIMIDNSKSNEFDVKTTPQGRPPLYNTIQEYKEATRNYRRNDYLKNREKIIERSEEYYQK